MELDTKGLSGEAKRACRDASPANRTEL